MIQSGAVIDGRYEVHSRIGTGGMADVYLARDRLLGREVAVKVLHHRFAEDQEFVERFRREASSAASLSHPNVVAIFDRGEWDGTYYIAMEYLPGRSLKAVVRDGPLEPAAAIDIVIQILHAARFAHRRGLIHRDLKPHNVILDEEGRAKVTDFGIARAGASDMTLTGSIMGTAQYLSPEQAQGHAVSAASDLYAVGIILYELLTGFVPFDGETAVTIALKQVSAVPPPPSTLARPGSISPELDAIVLRALAKSPVERFADAGEFIAALERVRAGLPGGGTRGAAPAGERAWAPVGNGSPGGLTPPPATSLLLPLQAPPPPPEPDPVQAARRRRRRWWGAAAALLVALLLAGAALALLAPGGRHQVTVPSVTGVPSAAATAALQAHGLVPAPSQAPSATVPVGAVVSESPAAGTVVARGTRVAIVVSSGPGSTGVPDVKNLTGAQAKQRLTQAGLKPTLQSRSSTSVPAGKVIDTEPSQGVEVLAGSPVTVLVSSGPAQVSVPEVTGQSEGEARASLRAAGLHVGAVTHQEAAAGQAPGTVLSQAPLAGSSVASGSAVALVVAHAPQEVTVPRVVGHKRERAEGELAGAGFTVRSSESTVSTEAEAGIVLQQSPAGGRKAKRGATVTLTVGVLGTSTTTTPTTPTTTTTTPTTATPPAAATPPAGPTG